MSFVLREWLPVKTSLLSVSVDLPRGAPLTEYNLALRSGEGSGISGPEDQRIPRGAFPRGFGRENDKFKIVRTENLMKKSGGKPRR